VGVVQRSRTPLSGIDVAVALRDGHYLAFGQPPTKPRLGVGWAQIALENARGDAVYRNNIGNVTAGTKWVSAGKPYYVIRVKERVQRNPDVWKELDLKFRAHETAVDGAADYWRLLAAPRYQPVLAAFDAGDPALAAQRLSDLNYYTAQEAPYERAMVSLYGEYNAKIAPNLLPWAEPTTPLVCDSPECDDTMRSLATADEIERVMSLVALTSDQILRDLDWGPPKDDGDGGGGENVA
jgi:hypothetical protein